MSEDRAYVLYCKQIISASRFSRCREHDEESLNVHFICHYRWSLTTLSTPIHGDAVEPVTFNHFKARSLTYSTTRHLHKSNMVELCIHKYTCTNHPPPPFCSHACIQAHTHTQTQRFLFILFHLLLQIAFQ